MHTHGPSSKNRVEARDTPRRAQSRASQAAVTGPMTADNAIALQRAIGNKAFSKLAPAAAAASATPVVQRVKTEEARGAHLRRIEMAETAADQLAHRVNATLAKHIFEGRPMTGAVNRNAPQGLHAYDDKALPDHIEEVETGAGAGNRDKVHVITWRYKKSQATKRSTMFPRWMPRHHVLALIALRQDSNLQDLAVNSSKNVRDGETRPVSAEEIRTHLLRGVELNLQMVGDTVYPTHAAF